MESHCHLDRHSHIQFLQRVRESYFGLFSGSRQRRRRGREEVPPRDKFSLPTRTASTCLCLYQASLNPFIIGVTMMGEGIAVVFKIRFPVLSPVAGKEEADIHHTLLHAPPFSRASGFNKHPVSASSFSSSSPDGRLILAHFRF